jgi:hypothetical protein
MPDLEVVKYESDQKRLWDEFVDNSRNGLFLFRRDYMEYHSDRFADHSLLFLSGGQLVGLMPANIADHVLNSHGGLTFGGVVSNSQMKAELMLELFDALKSYLRPRNISKVVYKAVPHIYHRLPSEEDLYALYRNGARLFRRDISSTIEMSARLSFGKGRKWAMKKARQQGLEVSRSFDFQGFMAIEEQVLAAKYGIRPAHTGEEISLLAGRFPDNIKLFTAGRRGEMLAGVIIYESEQVAHAQYISATEEGKQICALDAILEFLLDEYYSGKKYFDFGISSEKDGTFLNTGLIDNKQSYGARAVVHDFYEFGLD